MKYLCILFLFLFSFSAIGNNISVEGKTRVVEFLGNDTAVVEVTLLWDNSWRDDFNWDAAWVFFKYKKRGEINGWHRVLLSSSGHEVTSLPGNEGGGYTFMVGAGGGRVMGLYVLREGISEGNVKVSLRAKWPLSGSGLTKSDFGEDYKGVYVAVHAIEMVYIPYGAYSLGDGFSGNSFVGSEKQPLTIDNEDARSIYTLSSPAKSVSLPSSYPKGYAGFYVMKYEVSQEQYVEFLNSLTLSQQKSRVGNNDFEHMEKGDYVFGDLKRASCRNGIAFISQPRKEGPAVFGNNLNRENDFFSMDDGQTLACNYMSVEDMLSYCSWSGLRPMSELEYEKSCRRFYPQVPEKGEYAWNTSSGVNALQSESELSYRWSENEQALSKQRNVNSGGKINGPVRCGLFATSSTSQSEAGATYWGVMEMGGNMKELCVNVGYAAFDGSSVGLGEYNPGLWDVSFSNYGVRGGGFSSGDTLLRTSDRTEAVGYFSSSSHRDSTVGFRGVYGLSGIRIDGGEIRMSQATACWKGSDINTVREASCPDFPDVRFQYTWYVKKPGDARYELIEGKVGEELRYGNFENKGSSSVTYWFKRMGVCSMGVAESNEVSVTVLPEPFIASSYTFNPCPVAIPHQWQGLEKEWRIVENPAATVTDDGGSLWVSNLTSNGVYTLEAKWKGCPDVFSTQVKVTGTLVLTAAKTFSYTGSMQCIVLPTGKYKIEAWGAKGGNASSVNGGTKQGGLGGYAKGEITLQKPQMFYVYVGAAGVSKGGATFNGGGKGHGASQWGEDPSGGSGGGAADIRLEGGPWSRFASLKSRLLVASGGAGADGYNKGSVGGAAGGLTGYSGAKYAISGAGVYYNATGGSQTAGGLRGGPTTAIVSGGFGVGGNSGSVNYGGGGGGGYYGGGGGSSGHWVVGSGAGGSSFISGHTGCDAISASSISGNIVYTGQPKHYSGLYFTNTVMIDGQGYQWTTVKGSKVNMPNLAGTGTMVGNTGNGQVKITPLP